MTPDGLPEFFRSLANEKRQEILFTILADKQEHTVGEIAHKLMVAPSTASEHLAILKRSGVVSAVKKEREVYYQLDTARIRVVLASLTSWLDCC